MIVLHHAADDVLASHQDDQLPGPGHRGVEQVPGQQHGRPSDDRHDHRRKLAALGLVDGQAVGRLQRGKAAGFVNRFPVLVKKNRETAAVRIHGGDGSDVAVENPGAVLITGRRLPDPFEIVVVFCLDYLVAQAVDHIVPGQLGFGGRGGIQGFLQQEVQGMNAAFPLPGRREHLDIADGKGGSVRRGPAEIGRQPAGCQGQHGLGRFGEGRFALKEEIRVLFVQQGHFAVIDQVRVHDDAAGFALAVDIRQTGAGHRAAGKNVPEDVAGADAGQLVRVADQDQPRSGRNGPQQGTHQHQVDHGSFIGDHAVRLQRMIRVPGESPFLAAEFQQAVDGFRLGARGLRHPLGGPARRRAEQHGVFR